ncbi:hypothetical protein LJC71_07695 [Desulfosarcina sp. OttesenSCG-928-A07]|nr:hypothetical protein [Desulfosarcina sp. OttesenSCG-928-G17]MDL2329607.1 hypothetical protein [Desulfosarcina sp. OttesenSCG-928-A07]
MMIFRAGPPGLCLLLGVVRPLYGIFHSPFAMKRTAIALGVLWVIGLMGGCASLTPVARQPDPDAEAIVACLEKTNAGLSRFKGIGEIRISLPDQSVQVHRIAIAGEMKDHLRIDLLSPVGGSAVTFSSNGKHVFVIRHTPPVEYHKKRARSGIFRRLVGVDIQISDLLALFLGRIPIESGCTARMTVDDAGDVPSEGVSLADRKGRVRQQVFLDAEGNAENAVWFDKNGNPVHSLSCSGKYLVDEFVFFRQFELVTPDKTRLAVKMDRYFPGADMGEDLFSPVPPPKMRN